MKRKGKEKNQYTTCLDSTMLWGNKNIASSGNCDREDDSAGL